MNKHCILLIFFILFIINVSSSIYEAETIDMSDTITNIKNVITNMKNDFIAEQIKTSTEKYDGENLEKITASGSYHYTGEISTTITIQKSSGVVHLYLENANFFNPGAKIIDSKKEVNLIITLIGINSISNSNETATNVISINQDLTINGPGSLTINSSKNGIRCDGKFIGLGGTLNIRSKNHGISSDSIYLEGTDINIEELGDGKDGLHAESDDDGVSDVPSFDLLKGFVYIERGTINIQNSKGDGIQADSFAYISGGNIKIKTEPTWETFVATSSGIKGCFSKNGDKYTKVPKDNVRRGVTYYRLVNSCKGIKAGEIDYYLKDDESETEQIVSSSLYTILIEGGTIEIDSADDSIHTNSGNTLIYGGDMKLSTLDDGITADLNLIVKDGQINIETCYEGLEAQTVEIQGGNIKIVSDDDAINAAGESESLILFSGGKTYVYAKGDGIDSNGNIIMNGGEVYVVQSGRGDGPIDSDGEIVINGGKLVAVGESGMPGVPSSSSSQCVIVRKISTASDDILLRTSNSNDDPILSFEISSIFGIKVSYSLVILSSNLIKKCVSYDIVAGNSINSLITSGSSNVTSNVRSGWGPGGGGSSTGNDGENCPLESPTEASSSSVQTSQSSITNPTLSKSESSSTISITNPTFSKSESSSNITPTYVSSENHNIDDDDFSDTNKKNNTLSTGLIIGIVIACVVVVALLIGLLVYFLIIKNKNKDVYKESLLPTEAF